MWELVNLNFGFRALWSPGFIVAMLAAAALYFWAVGPWRSRLGNTESVPLHKKILFVCGLFLFYLGYGGPLYLMGHLMLSMHMTQMAVSLLIAPPLLILGTPTWLLKRIVEKIPFKAFLRFFTKPIVAILLFNILFSMYHFPIVFDYLMVHKLLHNLFQTVLFISALNMWWSIIIPVPEWIRSTDTQEWKGLSELKRIGLIFLDGVLITPACALIIFASAPLYATFSNPQIWAEALLLCLPGEDVYVPPDLIEQFLWLPLLEDQRLGGIIMKVIQEVMYGIFIGYTFMLWAKKEKKKDEEEGLSWTPVKH